MHPSFPARGRHHRPWPGATLIVPYPRGADADVVLGLALPLSIDSGRGRSRRNPPPNARKGPIPRYKPRDRTILPEPSSVCQAGLMSLAVDQR
jgi:hypothetical protein